MQVVDRLQEITSIKDLPPSALRASALAAHLGYGTAAGAVFGGAWALTRRLLSRESG